MENTSLHNLAKKVTDAFFNFDPFNGADYEDVFEAVERGLSVPEECHEIIEELSDMLLSI